MKKALPSLALFLALMSACWADDATDKMRQSAEQGDTTAQCNLGLAYANGFGVTKDSVEAVKWYRKAAEQGDATAQSILGFAYDIGKGVTKDSAEAVRWYRKAAEQGHTLAQYGLGVMYANGKGVTKDSAEAVKWWRKSAEQGYANAQYKLGVTYADGEGVIKDLVEAHAWFNIAGVEGDKNAQMLRDSIEKEMTKEQIAEATKRGEELLVTVREYLAQHPDPFAVIPLKPPAKSVKPPAKKTWDAVQKTAKPAPKKEPKNVPMDIAVAFIKVLAGCAGAWFVASQFEWARIAVFAEWACKIVGVLFLAFLILNWLAAPSGGGGDEDGYEGPVGRQGL